ncbi:hypothetical protein [Cytobacillus gottheilii]|uniref:hypothetical protein n=1 Tax=Cytobacillus gottheilii TaxID=859144 RepID=UPI00082D67F4|nr:hypothetical protein [Cytobacillus gottheilii]
MRKLASSLFVMLLLFQIFVSPVAANQMSREYYPPADSDYYQKKMSYQLYISHGTKKVRMTQYKSGVPMTDDSVITTVTWDVKENSFIWMDMTCKGPTVFHYLDAAGEVVASHVRGESSSNLKEGSCAPGDVIKLSDFNEDANQYKSDTFGGTKPKLTKPDTPDGSGGDGDSGYLPPGSNDGGSDGGGTEPGGDDGSGSDGGTDPGGTDPDGGSGGDSGSGSCDSCQVFECPGWDEYMGGLEDIKNAIPPAPNWKDVADTFRDSIAPKIKQDMADLLGSAPSKPAAPSLPSGVNDGGFKNSAPTGSEAPGLGDTDFGTIKDEAPVIEEVPDTTDGFEINNPIDTFPSQEEFLENVPEDFDNPAPAAPEDNIGSPPTPPDVGDGVAPIPDDSSGNAPIPGDQGGTAPLPSDDGGNAPMPTDPGDSAPIPGDSDDTFPIPGQ